MEFFIGVLGNIFNFIQGYFFFKTLCCLLKPRRPRALLVLNWFLCSMISCVAIFSEDPVNILLVLCLFFGTMVLFQGPWYVKISCIMLLYPIVASLNFLLSNLGARIFFTFWGGMGFLNFLTYRLAQSIPMLFWCLFYRFMKHRLQKAGQLLDRRSWLFLSLICLASLAGVISLVCFTPRLETAAYPCMLACIVTNFSSIYLSSYLADRIQEDMERKNLRLQKEYYKELENNQLQIRRLRHDMNNHFAVAESLLKSGKIKEALKYFEALTGYIEAGTRSFCKNGIVNAILNAKYNRALEEDIDCFFRIDIDGLIDMDDISLCTIFSNTLDNAIEACCKIPETSKRKMSVKARYTPEGYFSYEITNTKANKIQEKNGRYLSDKEEPSSHGLGIASVKEIVKKYEGTIHISYTEDEFSVVILIG